MARSPGHRNWPGHKVREQHLGDRMIVRIDGDVVADSNDIVRVDEDGAPARYYFPRDSVRMDRMRRTATTTECPFKGMARYFTLSAGGKQLDDAAWSYEDPYEEHLDLKDRVAFYDDRLPEIEVRPAPPT
jgi:uncharacterized protein (DUF427 family)